MSISNEERQSNFKEVSDDLRDGGKIFGTTIAKEIALEDYQEGLKDQTTLASEGKILIKCD